MKTTITNYFEQVKNVNFSSLPEALSKGHEYAKKISPSNWKPYHANDSIKRVVDLYFEQLDSHITQNIKPSSSVATRPEPRPKVLIVDSPVKTPGKVKNKKELTSEKQTKRAENKISTPEPYKKESQTKPASFNSQLEMQIGLLNKVVVCSTKNVAAREINKLADDLAKVVPIPEIKSTMVQAREKLGKAKQVVKKNGYDKIKLVFGNQKFATEIADIIAEGKQHDSKLKQLNSEGCFAVQLPISEVHTDTARFQNRKDAFSEISAQAVAAHFDINKFDPIIVWKSNDNKVYVISGHSRLEGMKRKKARFIPVRFFEGTQQEAITFAKVEANRSQNRENLAEDLAAFKLLKEGDKKKGIAPEPLSKIKLVFHDRTNTLDTYCYLNPNGLFIQALSATNQTEFPYIERTARWVGELRKNNDRLTNLMEDNAFNFFYADKQGKNIKIAKDDFMKLVNTRLDSMKSNERLLFTQDGQTIDEAKRLLDDKLKGDGYKKLKEINEILRFISQRLKTTDRKIKVWTKEEESYLKNELSNKLTEEKRRIERDINYLDEQKELFGLGVVTLGGCDCLKTNSGTRTKKKKAKKKAPVARTKIKLMKPLLDQPIAMPDNATQVNLNGTVSPMSTEQPDFSATMEEVNVDTQEMTATQTTLPKPLNGLEQLGNDHRRNGRLGNGRRGNGKIDKPPGDVNHYFAKRQQKAASFTLPTKPGMLLGEIEQFEYALVLRGDKGAGKTRFLHRLMNAFAYKFPRIAFISLEIDQNSIQLDRLKAEYIEPENQSKIFTTSMADKITNVEEIASNFPVVVIDSWSKIKDAKITDFDRIRKQYPNTMFLVIFQSTTNKTARGGLMPEYDAQAVFHVHAGGIVKTEKNRFSGEDYAYNVFTDELFDASVMEA